MLVDTFAGSGFEGLERMLADAFAGSRFEGYFGEGSGFEGLERMLAEATRSTGLSLYASATNCGSGLGEQPLTGQCCRQAGADYYYKMVQLSPLASASILSSPSNPEPTRENPSNPEPAKVNKRHTFSYFGFKDHALKDGDNDQPEPSHRGKSDVQDENGVEMVFSFF
ncbi:uncharacterized protein A4U43_C06F690 [Asparagus officinalis]|uniref:Uncharacterized protein n=1 Tax=Asparagus officinalis TaxID=4686 RepID=A0A5P1EJ39_ASPOF|nr:uncharacterized protein A4U43_C06F690 [Asparagus officinalis]